MRSEAGPTSPLSLAQHNHILKAIFSCIKIRYCNHLMLTTNLCLNLPNPLKSKSNSKCKLKIELEPWPYYKHFNIYCTYN